MTIESSFHGYIDENRETKIFNESNLQYFGQAFCQSVFEYLLILEENKRQKLALAKKLSKKRKFQKRKTIKEILGGNNNEMSFSDKEIQEHENKNIAVKNSTRKYKSKSPVKRGMRQMFQSSSSDKSGKKS